MPFFEQAYNELPNETCGLLGGTQTEVVKHFPMTDIDHSPKHFSFDPAEQFKLLREARSEGLQNIAIFHNHAETPSRPSEEDIRWAYAPNILYFIASLAAEIPVLKAFRIQNGKVTEEIISYEVYQ